MSASGVVPPVVNLQNVPTVRVVPPVETACFATVCVVPVWPRVTDARR
jgi:hypothetical protein